MTYFWLLLLHGVLRWLVLAVGVFAILKAWRAARRATWDRLDDKLGAAFIGLLDTQLLVGIVLYAISPVRIAAYAHPAAALDNEMGFFAFLHPTLMVTAVIVAHVGKALSKRATAPVKKQAFLLKYFIAAMVLMAIAIPWWRPLLRY